MRFAIVDGYSTGNFLVRELRDRGASCFHVSSQKHMPSLFTRSFDSALYEADLGHVRSDVLLVKLRQLGIETVIAGTESGVLLTDELNHSLKLPGHKWDTRLARRDKSLMSEVVSAAGLKTPRGVLFTSPEEAMDWYEDSQLKNVVIKPLDSAGSDNVHFCTNSFEIGLACDRVVTGTNLYGKTNGKGLIQETVGGTEYYVNSVSIDGAHTMVETWRYTKRSAHGSNVVYDFESPLNVAQPEASIVHNFVSRVLSALGIQNGAAHTEVIVSSGQPVLIETGARLGGGTLPWVTEKYTGTSQTRVLARALTGDLKSQATEPVQVEWNLPVRNMNLINECPGAVKNMLWVERLESLTSAAAVVPAVALGTRLEATTDLASSPGFVYLVHPDKTVVERDYTTIRDWERRGFYTAG